MGTLTKAALSNKPIIQSNGAVSKESETITHTCRIFACFEVTAPLSKGSGVPARRVARGER